MRNILITISAVGMLSVLAGCDMLPLDLPVMAARPTAYHGVSYYDANPMERSQANAWCNDNPGLAKNTPSCDSADESGIHAWNSKMGFK